MQILLNSDPNINGGHLMAEHLKQVVTDALSRFNEQVTRVEAHLSDVNSSAKSGANDIHCTLEARLVGLDPMVVKDHAGNAHQAIDGAVRKLKRAIETVGRRLAGRATMPGKTPKRIDGPAVRQRCSPAQCSTLPLSG